MKIKALRTLVGHYGRVEEGQVFDPGPATAKSLLDRGLAVKVKGDAPHPNKKAATASNKAARAPLAGSRTGGGRQPSS